MSFNHKGKRFNKQSKAEFEALSAEDLRFYQEVGARASMAWRSGHAGFGPRAPRQEALEPPPGLSTRAGAIVLAGPERGVGELVPASSCTFEDDLRKLRVKFLKQSKQFIKQERESVGMGMQQESALLQQQSMEILPALPASRTFGAACASAFAGPTELTWLPPSEEFVKAWLCNTNAQQCGMSSA